MENKTKELISIRNRFDELFLPTTKEDLYKLAEMYAKSNLTPACFRGKSADIVIAWSLGFPLGLNMMQCLLGIAVINGRPSLWGDVLNGLILSQLDLEIFDEVFDKNKFEWTCTIKRKGRNKIVRTFSKEDAVVAGLWDDPSKKHTWGKYPKRMVQMRCRGFCVRDAYADKLCGLGVEPGEIIDIEVVEKNGEASNQGKTSIVGKIATMAAEANGSGPEPPSTASESTEETELTTPPPVEENPQFRDVGEVIDAFREAADIPTLTSMQDLINEVDPAFCQEARKELDRAFANLNASTPNEKQEPAQPKNKKSMPWLAGVCVGLSREKKAQIAGELFNDKRKTNFYVKDLDQEQREKLGDILISQGLYQEDQ